MDDEWDEDYSEFDEDEDLELAADEDDEDEIEYNYKMNRVPPQFFFVEVATEASQTFLKHLLEQRPEQYNQVSLMMEAAELGWKFSEILYEQRLKHKDLFDPEDNE